MRTIAAIAQDARPTPKVAEFTTYVEHELEGVTPIPFKSKACKEAFELGLRLGVKGYIVFQAHNREQAAQPSTARPGRPRGHTASRSPSGRVKK